MIEMFDGNMQRAAASAGDEQDDDSGSAMTSGFPLDISLDATGGAVIVGSGPYWGSEARVRALADTFMDYALTKASWGHKSRYATTG
jgi:hypothetical protein